MGSMGSVEGETGTACISGPRAKVVSYWGGLEGEI